MKQSFTFTYVYIAKNKIHKLTKYCSTTNVFVPPEIIYYIVLHIVACPLR